MRSLYNENKTPQGKKKERKGGAGGRKEGRKGGREEKGSLFKVEEKPLQTNGQKN